ncbi:hypothetical protein Hanom_Chr09g00796691 [Helianthus anomalus]
MKRIEEKLIRIFIKYKWVVRGESSDGAVLPEPWIPTITFKVEREGELKILFYKVTVLYVLCFIYIFILIINKNATSPCHIR